MGRTTVLTFALALSLIGSNSANAGMCDYRLSGLMGADATAAFATSASSVAVGGTAMTAAGFYTITNATTGATMLASTAGGASGAGTVGIMGGTAGVVGTASSIVMAPAVIAAAAGAALGAVGIEGACYMADDRITDYDQVLMAVRNAASKIDPSVFKVVEPAGSKHGDYILVKDRKGNFSGYAVANLFIVNGELMNRDRLRNTDVMNLNMFMADSAAD
ncbi:MAG: hypothetical protein WAT77_13610 [Paracoccaceae bacterium]